MNDITFPTALALSAGLVLLYAGVKGIYPQDVIRQLMGKPPIHPPLGAVKSFGHALQPSGLVTPAPGTTPGITVPGQIVTTV